MLTNNLLDSLEADRYVVIRIDHGLRIRTPNSEETEIIIAILSNIHGYRYIKKIREIINYEATILDSPFGYASASDVLRYYLLWKCGGGYIDSDDIARKNLHETFNNLYLKRKHL